MIVLVFLTETALTHFRPRFDSLDFASYRFPNAAYRDVGRCRILAFGDSLVKHAILPRVVEERLGRSAFNLAVPGGAPAASYILLRRVLESGARPDAVLVDFKSTNVSVDPRAAVVNLSALPTLKEGLELAWNYRDPEFLATLFIGRTLTSYQCRRNLRSVVWRQFDPSHPLDFFPMAPYWRNWEQNRGGQLNEKNPQSLAPDGPKNFATYLRPHWAANRRSERYIVRFLALAEAHQLPVYWLMPPTHPKLQAWRDERRADASYETFVVALQKRFPNVRVIDGRRSGYGADVFWDAVHLDRDGALAFSSQVADVLHAGRASAERWVSLPRPSLSEPRPAMEDVAQSRLAVGHEIIERR